jgi:TonB-dependent SusC/RagA subfamily outer membrane receptor
VTPAVAKPRSLLERRLHMIVNNVSGTKPLRTLAMLAMCALLAVAACESPPPTGVQSDLGEVTDVSQQTAAAPEASQMIDISPSEGEPPLVYVDGIRIASGLSDLDTESIDRIEVIKGAAAEAMFGAEAAHGVIHIFTKARPPEILIDDVRFSGVLSEIDPNDIESIEALTADGGSRVLVKTKGSDGPG